MRTYTRRIFISLIAVSALLFANAAVAQDGTELPQTQAGCEAAGYHWFPEGAWGFPGRPAVCADIASLAEPPAEPAPTEPAPAQQLSQSQPAPAQQGAPQYTG